MSAGKTKFPKSTVPARKIHQQTVVVGKNGLPIDALATIEPGSVLINSNGTPITYTAPTVTFDSSVDLAELINFNVKDAEHTGKLIFNDSENNSFFIDPDSIDNINKTLDIYSLPNLTNPPSNIAVSSIWFASEAELVNRLQTTTTAVIDNVEFRDVSVNVDLDGSTVNIKDDDGHQLEIEANGNANVKLHGEDQDNVDRIIKTSRRRELVNIDHRAQDTIEELNFGVTTGLNAISGTGEVNYLLLKNPIENDKTLRLFKTRSGVFSKTTTSLFRTYILPDIQNNGTPLTIRNLYIKTSPVTSTAEAFIFPSINNRGTLTFNTVTPVQSRTTVENFESYFILDPGISILITIQNDQNNQPVHLDLFWTEI